MYNQNKKLPEICARVQMLPELTGMTYYSIAQQIGKPQASINNIIKRGTLPSATMLQLLCKQLHINANWLLLGEGNWKQPQKRH